MNKFIASALIATSGLLATVGAQAQDNTPFPEMNAPSILNRADVRAEALADAADKRARGYSAESGTYLITARAVASDVTRAEVREQAIAARANQIVESNS